MGNDFLIVLLFCTCANGLKGIGQSGLALLLSIFFNEYLLHRPLPFPGLIFWFLL